MTRRLAALLTCALMVCGQPSQTPPSPSRPATRFLAAVVLDAAGRPVPDLSADDFEVSQSGRPRKISQFTWFDTRLHTARAGAESAPVELVPDEIHRNLIAIVDDLGLPAVGIEAVQAGLRRFMTEQMGSGERMAVLRTSSGSGDLQQLTGDRRILGAAIDRLQFLGGGAAEKTAAAACWLTLRHALEGLRDIPGRKFVVVFSQSLASPGARDPVVKELALEASAAMAAVYAVDPRGAVAADSARPAFPPLAALARDTGGAFGVDLPKVLQAEEGFYTIGFEEPGADSLARPSAEPATLKVRRPGVNVHAPSGYLRVEPRPDFPAPVERSLQIARALLSPYEGADIRTRLTATFTAFAGQAATIDVGVVIDGRALAMIHDAKDTWRASTKLIVAARSEESGSVSPVERSYDLAMTPEIYQRVLRDGLVDSVVLQLPSPGVWQIRAVVADGISDRLGSAVQCIEIPAPNRFSISGLQLHGAGPSNGKDPAADPREHSAVRIFKIGRPLEFTYSILNALADEQKKSRVEIQSRIYARGHAVYSGVPSQLAYPVQAGARQLVSGRLFPSADLTAGDYILEITVTDTLAPARAARTVSRFVDFQLHD
jgi:VWFA-related protein